MKHRLKYFLFIPALIIQGLCWLIMMPSYIPSWELPVMIFVSICYVGCLALLVYNIYAVLERFKQKFSRVVYILIFVAATGLVLGWLYCAGIVTYFVTRDNFLSTEEYYKTLHEEKLNKDIYLYKETFIGYWLRVYVKQDGVPFKEKVTNLGWRQADSLKVDSRDKILILLTGRDSVEYNIHTGELKKYYR